MDIKVGTVRKLHENGHYPWCPTSVCVTLAEEFKEERVSFRFQFMAEKSWQREPEVAGLFASTDKKPRELNAGTQLAFSFIFMLEPQPAEWNRPQWARRSTSICLI